MSCELPTPFVHRLEELYPERAACIVDRLGRERLTAFRINRLRADPDTVLARLGGEHFTLTPLPWLDDAYTVPPQQRRALTESAVFAEGLIYIQNPASMLPPVLLRPAAEERVLDLAAAPGSKTLQLAAQMNNAGWISAVEPVKSRFFRLRRNLDHYGATNVHTYMKDGSRVWRAVPESFDCVLLDAPCSSEGQFRCDVPESYAYWSEKKVKEMARKQKRLLYSAIQCLKPGGRLVYSTCTLSPEENEAVVEAMLRKFDGRVQVVAPQFAPPEALPGMTQWRGKGYHPALTKALRILPDQLMEGFFVCVLTKQGSTLPR